VRVVVYTASIHPSYTSQSEINQSSFSHVVRSHPALCQCSKALYSRDALIYERVLREEYSIKTKLDIYPGLPYGFGASFPMLKSADKFRGDMVEGMVMAFGTKARDGQNQELR
jgi:hypothetical protein